MTRNSFTVWKIVAATALLIAAWVSTPAATAQFNKDQEKHLDNYAQVSALVAYFLENQHFSQHPIDRDVALEWLENYMMDLDPNRMIFLSSDYTDFRERFAGPIVQAVNNEIDVPSFSFFGNRAPIRASEAFASMAVEPAFIIYKRFTQRVNERIDWALDRLQKPFTFDTDEYYQIDRSEADWPATVEDANHLWEKRMKYEILQDQLSGLGDSENDEDADDSDPITAESFEVSTETREKIAKRYERIRNYSEQTDHQDVIEIYLTALTSTYDPHSQYLSQKTLEDFQIMMQQKLVGIGAILSIDPRTGYCTIREIMPGGPADMDGRLQVNDRIVAVAQGDAELVDVYDMKLRDTVRLIRGQTGTTVRLEVIPADADDTSTRTIIDLVRNEISVTMQKAKARHITFDKEINGLPVRLGLIELPSFYGDKEEGNSTTEDVRILIEELENEGIDGLVLDLRNNGGGLLNEAIKLAGLFIDKGPVVQVKTSSGRESTYDDPQSGIEYDGPMIVLTNKLSASASEIVAGALQNYGRAIIIGDESTHGKGTVQTVAQLKDYLKLDGAVGDMAGAMKLTVQQFYLPDGTSTQGRGIIPDISLPSLNDHIEIGESTLPHALPWDQIDAVDFSPMSALSDPLLDTLTQRSRDRILQDGDFSLLSEDITKLQERMENKRESLNLESRLQEKSESDELRELKDAALDRQYDKLPRILSITFDEDREIKKEVVKAVKPDELDEDEKLPFSAVYATDLHLRETLNVLADWVQLQTGDQGDERIALTEKPASDS